MNDRGDVVGGSRVDVDDMALRIAIGKGLDSVGPHHTLNIAGR